MKRICSHPRRTTRRTYAAQKDAENARYSPEQQLVRLDKRLGRNVGAKKERERLTNIIVANLIK